MDELQVLTLTNAEAWAIDCFVRASDHGKPWGEWGENLLRKVFRAIAETENKPNTKAIILLNAQELWAIESQIRHLYREGPVLVGRDLLLKVQGALLELLRREDIRDARDSSACTDTGRDARADSGAGATA